MIPLFRRLARQVSGNQFARSIGVLASGTVAGQLLIVLASPLLTRLYGPGEFGAFAVFSSLLFTLLQIALLRYEMAILLPDSDGRAANLLALSLAVAAGMSLLTGLGVLLLGDALVAWTGTPGLRPYLWLLPVSLFGAALYQGISHWSIRRKAFSHISRTNVSQNLGRVATQLGLGWLGAGTLGLILGDVLGRWLGTGSLAVLTRRREMPDLRQVQGSAMLAEARRYRRFPLLASISGLLNQAGVQMPVLLLAGLYGPQVAGWYGLGQRVINLPMVMVGHAIAHVFSQRAAVLARSDAPSLARLLGKTGGLLALAGAVPFSLLALFGPELFARVFGAGWAETGRYAQVLALMSLAELVAIPVSRTLAVLERQELQLGWDAGRLALMAGVLFLAARGGLSAYRAIALFGAAMTAAYAVLLVLVALAARRAGPRGELAAAVPPVESQV